MSAPTQSAFEIRSGVVLKGRLSMVKDVVLTGKFEGELQTLGCLTVARGGVVKGEIDAGALVLEPGNLVEARVKVSAAPRPAPNTVSQEIKKAAGSLWTNPWTKLKEMVLGRK